MSFIPQTKLTASDLPSGYTYADLGRHVFGIEYMGSVFAKLRATPALNLKITLRGDSTIVGNGAPTAAYQPANILSIMLSSRGVACTITNGGVGGETSANWLNTRLPADLAGVQPDIYLIGYLSNDPVVGPISAAQSIANLRAGLALLRASWPATSTAVIVKMPNTASDLLGRTEAAIEALSEGVRRACRDFGCVFVDTYAAFPESRQNKATDWLDSFNVHPNEDFYMVQWGMIADAIAPRALQDMMGRPMPVTNIASGFAQGTDPLTVFAEGRIVGVDGFLIGPLTTVASGLTVCTIPTGYRPRLANFYADARVWTGSSGSVAANWQSLRVLLNTNGTVVTMEASTLNVGRFTLDGVTWRRAP